MLLVILILNYSRSSESIARTVHLPFGEIEKSNIFIIYFKECCVFFLFNTVHKIVSKVSLFSLQPTTVIMRGISAIEKWKSGILINVIYVLEFRITF